jgi:hypothetical protein
MVRIIVIVMLLNYISTAAADTTPGVVTLDLSWATDVAALLGILGIVGGGITMWIRREIKKYFAEIKAEFKPNGGGSFKDQVNRLEARHDQLDAKFDTILEILSSAYGSKIKIDTDQIKTVNNRYVHFPSEDKKK